jgi:hypothetical protein
VGFSRRAHVVASGSELGRHREVDYELGDDRRLRATGLSNGARRLPKVFNADLHKLMSMHSSCDQNEP